MLGGVFLKTVPVTKARQSIYKLIDESIKHSEPIQITTKKWKCNLNWRRRLEGNSRDYASIINPRYERVYSRRWKGKN